LRCAHARYAHYAAQRLGYDFASLDGEDGYLFEVRGGGKRAFFSAASGSPYALNDARAAALARDKAFAAAALARAGVSTPPGRLFFVTGEQKELRAPGRELGDAIAFAKTAVYPLFCKPVSASKGALAEIVTDLRGFEDYIRRAGRTHHAILAQPYIRAPEHRVFVLQGAPLFSYKKLAPEIVGDGKSTVAMLAQRTNPLARANDGAMLGPDCVMAAGTRAELAGPSNRALGGACENLRGGASPELAHAACAAAKALGLKLAGVDIFACPEGPLVIEANASPMIASLEEAGRWDLIETIWRANFEAALA
jgi:glutathione synthase/RimK-type ligase-like ATP-grasp enzyme